MLPRNVTLRTKIFFGTFVLTINFWNNASITWDCWCDCELRSNISIKFGYGVVGLSRVPSPQWQRHGNVVILKSMACLVSVWAKYIMYSMRKRSYLLEKCFSKLRKSIIRTILTECWFPDDFFDLIQSWLRRLPVNNSLHSGFTKSQEQKLISQK